MRRTCAMLAAEWTGWFSDAHECDGGDNCIPAAKNNHTCLSNITGKILDTTPQPSNNSRYAPSISEG
jgi:hypothetical protein